MKICLGLTENEAENAFQIKAQQNKTKNPSPYWKFKVGNGHIGKKNFFLHTGQQWMTNQCDLVRGYQLSHINLGIQLIFNVNQLYLELCGTVSFTIPCKYSQNQYYHWTKLLNTEKM